MQRLSIIPALVLCLITLLAPYDNKHISVIFTSVVCLHLTFLSISLSSFKDILSEMCSDIVFDRRSVIYARVISTIHIL